MSQYRVAGELEVNGKKVEAFGIADKVISAMGDFYTSEIWVRDDSKFYHLRLLRERTTSGTKRADLKAALDVLRQTFGVDELCVPAPKFLCPAEIAHNLGWQD